MGVGNAMKFVSIKNIMNVDCTWIVICGTGALYDVSTTFPLYFWLFLYWPAKGDKYFYFVGDFEFWVLRLV